MTTNRYPGLRSCRPTLVSRASIALCLAMCPAFVASAHESAAVDRDAIRDALHFHAPFDESADARVFAGDGRIRTADSAKLLRVSPGLTAPGVSLVRDAGKHGGCLRFARKTEQVVLFEGLEMPFAEQDWSGTVSLWLRLDPDEDLPPGYCDPLQITDKAWNDAAFFIDFDRDLPRDFRLGVFSDYGHWNPDDIPWADWPVDKRPMITKRRPPFSADRWTHVAWTFENVNPTGDAVSRATLFLDGEPVGSLEGSWKFNWEPANVSVLLGLSYVGDLDELMIFRRSLSGDEIRFLYENPAGP